MKSAQPGGTYVVFADGKCEAVDRYGIGTEAACELVQEGSDRRLKISYTSPGVSYKSSETFLLLKGHAFHPSLAKSAYARRK